MTDFSRHNSPILAAHRLFLKRTTRTIPRQSLPGSLDEPEVSGLWDWDSKVPRGTLINHVPVAAVTSPTSNEFLHIFQQKFPTQSLKHVINWYKVLEYSDSPTVAERL